MPYIKLEDLQKFPIRKDHYDKVHGNEHFIYGVESVLEYAEYLPTYDDVTNSEGYAYTKGYADGYRKAVADLSNSIDERFHRLVRDVLSECEDQTNDKG